MLNNYISGEKKKISVNGVEYEVQLFQGEHSNEYLLSEMKDGKREGRCQLFKRGILYLAWTMKDNQRVGEVTEYENGKALGKESWESVLGDVERKMIENVKERLVMTIRCGGENENENEEIVIYRGGFDEEMNRHGYGIEYDRESGKEKFEGYWEKGKLIQIVREFDADNNKMIEYAEKESATVDILSRVPVYCGGYCIENGNKFVRHGIGYLIDETSGTATRESEWEHGKEKKGGTDLYGGWYVKGMKESIRGVLKNEKPEEMKDELLSNALNKPVEISSSVELADMVLRVSNLVICSDSCNDITTLDLSKFKWLQSIEIGNKCFTNAQSFTLNGLNRLKILNIGKKSFINDRYSYDESKSFHVLNCESLRLIQIGKYSFSDYSGKFELKNLPLLTSLKIGESGTNSCNFFWASFVIEGW